MPAYCTDGQLRRAWKIIHEDTDYDVLAELRKRAKDVIDGWIGTVFDVPFCPWLSVTGVADTTLTLDLQDIGYLVVGDTLMFYDNSAKKMGQVAGAVVSISGADVVISGLTGIAAGDEIARYSDVAVSSGRTTRVVGPPPEVNARAIDISRYYGHTDISTLQDATDPVVKAYESALEWGGMIREGTADLTGASAQSIGYLSTIDTEPAMSVSGTEYWGFDPAHPARSDRDTGSDDVDRGLGE